MLTARKIYTARYLMRGVFPLLLLTALFLLAAWNRAEARVKAWLHIRTRSPLPTAAVGIASIAAGFQGWAWKRTSAPERVLFIVAGFALVLPGATSDVIGFGCAATAIALQALIP